MAIAAADWRDAAAYDRLFAGDRRCFAWEWLRRMPAYADAWPAGAAPEQFGLLRLESPSLDALAARPLWSAACDPGVLLGDAGLADRGDRLDLARLRPFSNVTLGAQEIAHILLSDGLRSIRLDLRGSAPLSKPVALTWHVDGVQQIGPALAALAQLSALVRHRRFARSLHPPLRRARRWVTMLRVHDALASGVTTRELVSVLFDVDTTRPRWRTAVGPWRLRVQRLTAAARAAVEIGPSEWLSGRAG